MATPPRPDPQPPQGPQVISVGPATPGTPTMARTASVMECWTGGINSLVHPSVISGTEYAWGENILTRGGIPQTRPGMKFLVSIPGSNLQGMTIFQTSNSTYYMVVAVDGLVYSAPPPFKKFSRIKDLQFLAHAPIVTFCAAVQSVNNNLDGSITVITPKKVLIVQDGETRAGVWDGSSARHVDPSSPKYETPTGLWMSWANSRLWVAQGSMLIVSDIANPLSFTENTFLAERSNFELPGECTGLMQTTDLTGLLAFTAGTTTSFQSSVRDRTTWQTTANFQNLLLPNIGCVSGRSIVNQYGITYWMSQKGMVGLDAALATQHTSRLITCDGEMMRSKKRLSGDLSPVCAIAFENLMLVSVPSGSKDNSHTWVQDQTPMGANNDGSISHWTSVWSGFRPVQWALNPKGDRCYCASKDQTAIDSSRIHIWEAFDPSREDNQGGRISCQLETGMIANSTKQRFAYAELDLCEIWGDVDLQVYFGCSKGEWIKVLDTTLQAERGCFGSSKMQTMTAGSTIEAYRPQSRTVRTRDFSPIVADKGVESNDMPGVDKFHGLLIQWKGRMGIRRISIATTIEATSNYGSSHPSESGQHNAMNEAGETL